MKETYSRKHDVELKRKTKTVRHHLSTFQKIIATIASILGIITATITIYNFTASTDSQA